MRIERSAPLAILDRREGALVVPALAGVFSGQHGRPCEYVGLVFFVQTQASLDEARTLRILR